MLMSWIRIQYFPVRIQDSDPRRIKIKWIISTATRSMGKQFKTSTTNVLNSSICRMKVPLQV